MFYYKQIKDGKITSIEAKSLDAISPNFIKATKAEYDTFISSLPEPQPPEPTPDQLRLSEIVALSPEAITMPDMWDAIRILAWFHGIGD